MEIEEGWLKKVCDRINAIRITGVFKQGVHDPIEECDKILGVMNDYQIACYLAMSELRSRREAIKVSAAMPEVKAELEMIDASHRAASGFLQKSLKSQYGPVHLEIREGWQIVQCERRFKPRAA